MQHSFRPLGFAFAAFSFAAAVGSLLNGESTGENQDRISKLDRKLAKSNVPVDFTEKGGYLPSLLKQLDIHTDSQILVFSKTSFQQQYISPQKPRAIYFNDDTIVSFVQEAPVFELISVDPTAGLQFFTMEQGKTEKPHFKSERASCIACHGPINNGVPGVMIATVFPSLTGKPYFPTSELFHLTNHRSPLWERWGGYYVTGNLNGAQHRGNAFAPDPNHPDQLDDSHSNNVTSLKDRFDTSKYLAATSDIVALMTLEHQTGFLNIAASVGAEFRASGDLALSEYQLDAEVDRLVSYMLFIDETALDAPIEGNSTFTKTFAKRGVHDRRGRSLRDFDLQKRMFKHPLSYMIYSTAFDGLPAAARQKIYRRLYDVLTGKVTEGYEQRSPEERKEVLEILIQTKAGLPEFFKL